MRRSNIHTGIKLTPKQVNYICGDVVCEKYLNKFEILVDDNIYYTNVFFEFDRIQDLRDVIHLTYYMDNGISDKVLEIIKRNKGLNYNWAIAWASDKGYTEIVKLLLLNDRVDPSDNDNSAIRWAIRNEHIEIVKLLLQDDRVDPSVENNLAIKWASEEGHTEIVELLLKDPRVDPSTNNNMAVRWASMNGHIEIVKLLLQDDRVDPSDNNNYAIIYASINWHTEIVKLLIQHPKVRASLTKKEIEKYEKY